MFYCPSTWAVTFNWSSEQPTRPDRHRSQDSRSWLQATNLLHSPILRTWLFRITRHQLRRRDESYIQHRLSGNKIQRRICSIKWWLQLSEKWKSKNCILLKHVWYFINVLWIRQLFFGFKIQIFFSFDIQSSFLFSPILFLKYVGYFYSFKFTRLFITIDFTLVFIE